MARQANPSQPDALSESRACANGRVGVLLDGMAVITVKHRIWLAVALSAWLASSLAHGAIQVTETRWGFDGQIVAERFNILSVLVVNPSPSVFDGTLQVCRLSGPLGERRGEWFAQPCYVSPMASRWIQFYLWMEDGESVVLSWGPGPKERMTAGPVRSGAPSRVLLWDPEDPFLSSVGLKTFPDNLFPPTVAATDGLHTVVLDHVPRWESARREAFMDWVRRGGTVHMLQDNNGMYPTFPDDMAALNAARDRIVVGAGLVVRHASTRRGFDEKQLGRSGFPAPEVKGNKSVTVSSLDNRFFHALQSMTRPKFAWGLIYLMTMLYIALVGPVNWWLGRKWNDYKRPALFFVAVVAGFGMVFTVTGRRGYGETAAVHSIAYARSLGDGMHYDVTQWISAFVTRGADYTFQHEAPHNLYATAQEYESVNGVSQNGKDGTLTVDMPLYSTRTFMHRGRLAGDDVTASVVARDEDSDAKLARLEMSIGPAFPRAVLQVWVVYRNRLYELQQTGDRLVLKGGVAADGLDKFVTGDMGYGVPFGYGMYGMVAGDELTTPGAQTEAFRGMARLIVARAMGGTPAFARQWVHVTPEDDRLQLFVLARSPERFQVRSKGLGRQTGYVVYHTDVRRP